MGAEVIASLAAVVARGLDRRAVRATPMGGGCVGTVALVHLDDGGAVVLKTGGDPAALACEAEMLRYLAAHTALPVPGVLYDEPGAVIMERIETEGALTAAAEAHAGALIAELHAVSAPEYGFHRATVIGGLPQPNPWRDRWLDFFRDHRLLYMAAEAHRAGQLPAAMAARVETLAGRLDRWLTEPDAPSLIHGDLWAGNVLCRRGRIAGFIDPAIAFADAEIELAFGTLFGTFGAPFFEACATHRPLRPGFFEERRDLYNLYPLLVHVRLFGGGYVNQVGRTLDRYGV